MAEKMTTVSDMLDATAAVAATHAEGDRMHAEAASAAGSKIRPADAWDDIDTEPING